MARHPALPRAVAFMGAYLNERHRDHPETGCAAATPAVEIGRGSDAVRRVFTEHLESLVDCARAPANDAGEGGHDAPALAGSQAQRQEAGLAAVAPASSSPLSDGAAALVLTRESVARRLGRQPIARIHAHCAHAQDPEWFTTAPTGALKKLFARTGWQPREVDYYEVNEAFAVVPMAVMHDFDIPRERMNAHGGACAIGHPIGASGARIVVTLLGVLRAQGAKRGVASRCIGSGKATAVAVELL